MHAPHPPETLFRFDVPSGVAVVEMRQDDADAWSLSPGEQALLHPRATASRRRDFALGRRAAHRALAAIGRDDGPILRGSHRQPLWPAGVVGAISHGAGLALAAAAPREAWAGIGLDVEHRDRYFPDLPAEVAFGAEREWLEGLRGESRARATLAVFSAKESIYKALFPQVGGYFGFSAAEVAAGRAPGQLHARLAADLSGAFPANASFPVQCRWSGNLVATAVFLPAGWPGFR